MVMLFGKQISVSTTSHQHQEAESEDPSKNPPLMGGDSKTRVFVPDHHQENPQDSDGAADSDVKFRGEVDFLGLWAQESDDLRILHPGSCSKQSQSDDPTVLNPEPLRWFDPSNNNNLRILHPGSCSKQSQSDDPTVNFVSDGKRKRKASMFSDDENKKLGKRKKINKYPQVPTMNLSSEFRRGIIGKTIHGPAFLYRKKLEGSDVKKQQNRLLITEEEKLLDGFLTGDEREMFHGGGVNIDVFGVDGRGREFELRLSKWKTMIVINREWYKMVVANGAAAGHWVDIWGFRRQDAKIRFAVNFSSQ